MSNLKSIESNDQFNFKFDLHPQNNNKFTLKDNFQILNNGTIEVCSVHLSKSLNENGIGIKNKDCWLELISFFSSLEKNNRVTEKNEKNTVNTISKVVLF